MTGAGGGPTLVVLAAGRARRYGGCKPLAPVGPRGEAVIDLLASDALGVGFRTVVLVIGPATGPAIRYHVERCWPAAIDVRFAVQPAPLGTVHAVVSSDGVLDPGDRIGVGNADDLYGASALRALCDHLTSDDAHNALVGFRLRSSIVGDDPVTRGLCEVDERGFLTSVVERRQVFALGDDRFVSKDGRHPAEIPGDALVSMNLWGFTPAMRRLLERAMESARHSSADTELLLPEVVAEHVTVPSASGAATGSTFRVLGVDGRCIGVTHPDDLPLVQAELAQEVGSGERAAALWSGVA